MLSPYHMLNRTSGDSRLVEGVTIGDMGVKTIGNDLDNASIKFDRRVANGGGAARSRKGIPSYL